MHPHQNLTWFPTGPVYCRGGHRVVPRSQAPLGRTLPYRRAAGDRPRTTGTLDKIRKAGWRVDLGDRGLGDTLLGLALVQALHDGCDTDADLQYVGPRSKLMRRCSVPLRTRHGEGPQEVSSRRYAGWTESAIPEDVPTWLDLVDESRVQIHAALPMRYYLAVEQALGMRLPADCAPAPTFRATSAVQPFHVVFVDATSWPGRKDYGASGYGLVADALSRRLARPWRFSLISGHDSEPRQASNDTIEVLSGLDASDCVDVFASADLVIGNDTGLTHLAALTERADGTGPQVVGLYSRHAHTKWSTGGDRHHAVATAFSHMLALADRCPVRDGLDDTTWGSASSWARLPPEAIADFAGRVAGWW